MLFTSPLMLLGLGAVPVLVAVYWLRSRSQRVVVSSLAFWVDPRAPRQGGRILHRMQTPLTFLLELLAITAVVLAAAGPALRQRDAVRPLVVVLDDSFSMRAHGPDGSATPRTRGEEALLDVLRHEDYLVRFVLAGARPQLLGEPVREAARAAPLLTAWTCQSPGADLAAAAGLAVQVGGPTARVLVLTDHAPAENLVRGQIQWWAFGQPLANLAFTAATRTRSGDAERVLLEVANFSTSSGKARLTLEGGNLAAPRVSLVELGPGARRQVFLNLPAGSPPLRASLKADSDALEIDDAVQLLPESAKPLRVRIDLADAELRRAVQRALEATSETIVSDERPELIVCDRVGPIEQDAWRVEIVGANRPDAKPGKRGAAAYAGPFVIDRGNALSEGLWLTGVIWSGWPDAGLAGVPFLMAGNVPLVAEQEEIGGRRVQMNFVAETSTFQDMPDWPILFDNLVRWRRAGLSGPSASNVRLGQTVSVVVGGETKQVDVIAPGNVTTQVAVRGRRAVVPADRVGVYTVRTPDAEYRFACNAVSGDESNLLAPAQPTPPTEQAEAGKTEPALAVLGPLTASDSGTGSVSGRWGDWNRSAAYQDRLIGLRWLLVLAALAALTGHAAVVSHESRRTAA